MRRLLGSLLLLKLINLKGFSGFSAIPRKGIPKSVIEKPKRQKKELPTIELVKRRKSPALWRDDLQLNTTALAPIEPVKPEIMAPAGGWPQLKAAVANGANSVYLGLSAFSARARASNFDPYDGELADAVSYCHDYQVKVYVALNTLVFDNELEEVSELVQLCEKANVDALIVQDLGVAKMVRKVAPTLSIHTSTQQTVTSSDGVLFSLQQHEAERVVLGRELSVDEIGLVSSQSGDAEIEIFVHGALCVSYSGQCFSSEAWGGRSANRGQCAQACRLPYGLIQNGELTDLQDMSYLLSPQDLCGIDQVPSLIKAGVSCLKIEGRLKDAEYVAATTRAYRNAVDKAWEEITGETPTRQLAQPEEVSKEELRQVFARGQDEEHGGLIAGFLEGTRHQQVVRGRSPRHRGVHVGRVVATKSGGGLLVQGKAVSELKRGDGIVVDRGMAQEAELGGPIFDIQQISENEVIVHFSRDVTRKWKQGDDYYRKNNRTPLAPTGAHVWKTGDATVEKKMRRLSGAEPPRQTVQLSVSGEVGTPLVVTITNGIQTVSGMTDDDLQQAETNGLTPEKVKKAIGSLGNTKWGLTEIDLSGLETDVWCPMSWIKEARRRAVDEWQDIHDKQKQKSETGKDGSRMIGASQKLLDELSIEPNGGSPEQIQKPKLSVLARNIDQVNTICNLIENGSLVDEIIVDFLEVDGMKEAVHRIRQTSARVVIASPRIIKPGEAGIWKTLLRLEADGLLVRSNGLLYRMVQLGGCGATIELEDNLMVQIPELLGDFSLNAANALTALELLNSGLQRITVSYDLNANSITNMLQLMGHSQSSKVEIIGHCKMPVFHTEHCVFARFLSGGDSYLDCGHVCTRNNVHLRDQTGADNLVLADMGCRNTVFSSQSQSGVHSLGQWAETGVGRIRIELVDEGPTDVENIVKGYLDVLDGTQKPSQVWEILKEVKDSNGRASGVSLGSFNNKIERRAGEL